MSARDRIRDNNSAGDPATARAWGAVRRFAVTLTSQVLWQLAGFRMPDQSREVVNAEQFSGIGFFARPPSSGSPEAIAVMVGDANAPVIVAVRDEATRSKIAGAIAEDEAMVFSSQAVVYIKADGTIEARTAAGVAVPLALKSDVDALAHYVDNTLTLPVSGATAGPSAGATHAPASVGTTVLKGQ